MSRLPAWRAIASKSASRWSSVDPVRIATIAIKQSAKRLIVVPSRLLNLQARNIGRLSLATKMPVMSAYANFTEAGGLVSFGAVGADMLERAAMQMDRVLRGAKAGELPFEQAAIIPDAVSTPWAAVTSTGDVRPAEAVAVWGVGGLGAHAVQLLRLAGAAPIIAADPDEHARARALEYGADVALDSTAADFLTRIGQLTHGRGLDAAFDFAGVPVVREQAVQVLGEHGRLVLVGLTDKPLAVRDGTRFSYLRQQILGHYGSEAEHVVQLVDLVRAGRLEFSRSISGTFSLEDAPKAVEQLEKRIGSPVRLVLQP